MCLEGCLSCGEVCLLVGLCLELLFFYAVWSSESTRKRIRRGKTLCLSSRVQVVRKIVMQGVAKRNFLVGGLCGCVWLWWSE